MKNGDLGRRFLLNLSLRFSLSIFRNGLGIAHTFYQILLALKESIKAHFRLTPIAANVIANASGAIDLLFKQLARHINARSRWQAR